MRTAITNAWVELLENQEKLNYNNLGPEDAAELLLSEDCIGSEEVERLAEVGRRALVGKKKNTDNSDLGKLTAQTLLFVLDVVRLLHCSLHPMFGATFAWHTLVSLVTTRVSCWHKPIRYVCGDERSQAVLSNHESLRLHTSLLRTVA